jgi:diacylglycerol kinase (ATP)
LIELAERAARDGAEHLVVVGGDGALNEAANGILRANAAPDIAILPLGSGLDFVRTFGIPRDFDAAVRVALTGATRAVDAGRVHFRSWSGADGVRYFVNVGSAGMSGAVAARANAMDKRMGAKLSFYYALVAVFLRWKNTHVEVELDDGIRRAGRMHNVIVANGVWQGGGMKIAPDARPDDGLFDVLTIGDITKLDFARTSPKIYKGTHVTHPKVEVLRSRTVILDAAEPLPLELDGETVGTTPSRWEIAPKALNIRVPR